MNDKYVNKMRNHLEGENIKTKYNVLKYDGRHSDEEIKEICPEIKIFSDLEFKPHGVVPEGVMSSLTFDNGQFVSVVGGGEGLYGDGKSSFEVGFTDGSGGFDVEGWLSPEQVTQKMIDIQSKTLNKNKDERN
jgi:hypothetical protein